MLKPISITLPEKMIEQIDEMLLSKDFSSRSEFFRYLVRLWFFHQESAEAQGGRTGQGEKGRRGKAGEEKDADELIDLEYGIPKGVIKKIEEQAKLLN